MGAALRYGAMALFLRRAAAAERAYGFRAGTLIAKLRGMPSDVHMHTRPDKPLHGVLLSLKASLWGRAAVEEVPVRADTLRRAIQLLESAVAQGLVLERRGKDRG